MSTLDNWEFLVLGLPTWALVDGTWAALSQLADRLPEGYDISAYLMLALTIGNLSPLLLGFLLRDSSEKTVQQVIVGILFMGMISGVMMSIFWQCTIRMNGVEQSFPILLLFCFVGACSSSSNVTHFMFVSRSDPFCTTALSTGMGIGSMIAGLLGILQGLLLIDHGFSTSVYYACLTALYVPAICVMLRGKLKKELAGDPSSKALLLADEGTTTDYDESQFIVNNWGVLVIQAINSSLGYGLVPAIVSYSCGKFANASLVLLLATAIAAIIDPLGKAATMFVRFESLRSLCIATAILFILAGGLLLCASLPDDSELYDQNGGILPIVCYVSFGAMFGFTNTSVFRFYKSRVEHAHVHHAYRWSALASQSGALLGSVLAFSLVVTGSL